MRLPANTPLRLTLFGYYFSVAYLTDELEPYSSGPFKLRPFIRKPRKAFDHYQKMQYDAARGWRGGIGRIRFWWGKVA